MMVSITGYTRVPEEAWTVMKALWFDDPQWQRPNAEMLGFPTQKRLLRAGYRDEFHR